MEQNGDYQLHLDQQLLRLLSQESSQFLEMVSTCAFLIDSGSQPEQAKNKARELKSHLNGYLDRAIDFYRKHIAKER